MYSKHAFAPFMRAGRGRHHYPFMQSILRAPVNMYKTENSFEIMVFAPGRVKENFNVTTQGGELVVAYRPQEGLISPDWLKKEYSRGAFERRFAIDDSIDANNIRANYVDGVLQLSLPVIPGKEIPPQEIQVN